MVSIALLIFFVMATWTAVNNWIIVGRRNRFFEKLKRKQKEIKAGHTKAQSSYKSIVHEPTVADQENFLTYLVNRLFTTGRKLKPIVH